MKILVDMNLSPAWVKFLQGVGLEAVHWSDVGPPIASDNELMAWAAAQDCIVLTNDLDFGAILVATRRSRPSVILLRSQLLTPNAMGAAVAAAIERASTELNAGALLSIDEQQGRLRLLPFGD